MRSQTTPSPRLPTPQQLRPRCAMCSCVQSSLGTQDVPVRCHHLPGGDTMHTHSSRGAMQRAALHTLKRGRRQPRSREPALESQCDDRGVAVGQWPKSWGQGWPAAAAAAPSPEQAAFASFSRSGRLRWCQVAFVQHPPYPDTWAGTEATYPCREQGTCAEALG